MRGRPRNPCHADEELNGLLCYPKCRAGYQSSGCCLCRTAGPLSEAAVCGPGKDKIDGLCYDKCTPRNGWNYERRRDNIGKCSTVCPPGFLNIGIGGCQRPTHYKPGSLGLLKVYGKTRKIAYSTSKN